MYGFYASHEAHYNDIIQAPEIMVGEYSENGGTFGEFGIRWHTFSDGKSAARIEIYDDAWKLLEYFPRLFKRLARLNGTDPTPDDVKAVLLEMGFHDLTDRSEKVA